MRTKLPTVKALKYKTSNAKIIDIALTDDGFSYIYKIEFEVDVNAYLNNSIASVRARALTTMPKKDSSSLAKTMSKRGSAVSSDVNAVKAKTINERTTDKTTSSQSENGEYFVKASSLSSKPSKSSSVGSDIGTLKFELMKQYDSYQKSIDKVLISQTLTSFETIISTQLTDLIKLLKAGSTSTSSQASALKSSGLTGNLKSKRKRITIPTTISEDFDFIPVSVSEAEKLYGKNRNKIPTPYVVLQESFSEDIKKEKLIDYESDYRTGVRKKKSGGKKKQNKSNIKDISTNTSKFQASRNKQLSSTSTSIQDACWKLIMYNGVSPPNYIPMDLDDLITSAEATYQGCKKVTKSELSDACLATKLPKKKTTCKKSSSEEQEALLDDIRGTLVKMPATRQNSMGDLNSDALVPIKVNKTLETVSSSVELEISDSDLQSVKTFIVSVDLLNTSNQIVDNIKVSVNHAMLKADFVDISEPPVISVTSSENKTVNISVSQVDNDATIVKIFKKQVDYNTLTLGSAFKLFATIPLASSDSEVSFSDSGPGSLSTAVVYRAVAYSKIGASGAFSDAIFRLSDIVDKKSDSSVHHGCISTTNLIAGIGVEAKTIVGEPINIQLIKRNLSRHEKEYEVIYDPTHPDLSGVPGKNSKTSKKIRSPSVIDTNVNDGEIYEYRIKSFFIDGTEKISCSCAIAEYKYPSSGISLGSTLPATVNVGSSGKKVGFDVSLKNTTENDEQFLKKFFDQNNLSSLYTSEIKSMKNELSKIFAMKITRQDLKTGNVVDLGIYPAGKFTDKGSFGTNLPRTDRSYEYKIEAIVRDPEFLLEEMRKGKGVTADKKFKDGRSPTVGSDIGTIPSDENPNYRSKFLSRNTIGTSTIMNSDALISKKSGGLIEQGLTGVTKTIRVEGSRRVPVVVKGQVKYNINEQVIISWSLGGTGPTSYSVDYFIISATRIGSVTYPVRVCHGQLKGNKFVVVDDTQSDMVGNVMYSVTPVLDDFSLGDTVNVGKVLIK